MANLLSNIRVLILIVGASFGVFFFVDGRYAASKDVQKLEQRVKLNELRNMERMAKEDSYFYREQSRKYPRDEQIKTKLNEAELEVKKIENRITEIEIKEEQW